MSALLAVLLAFPVVVMYHRVDVSAPPDRISQKLTVSPAQFADELRSIHQMGFRTIGIAELARDMTTGQAPERAVLITFDDGYSDQFRYAFPILQRFGDSATFFVNVGTIGTPHHLTWADVEAMSKAGMSIECHGVDHVNLASLGLAAQTYQIGECVRTLAAHVQGSVLAYAYPSGGFDARTIELERREGLLFGFTTDPKFRKDALSPYQLTRIRIMNGMNEARFASLLEGTRSFVDFASGSSLSAVCRSARQRRSVQCLSF
jgi:peptidoglycan/xylan/chitin deacetylase (PgdA/CDA1 family)